MEIENSGRREYKMIWKIENFRYAWHKMGEKLVSPEFVIRNSSWKLEIYPRGVENEEYIGCFLARTDNCTFWDGTVHYQFFATQSGGLTKTFVKDRVYLQCGEKDGFPLFVKREEIIDGIQPLTLTCKMVILYNATSIFCVESFVRTHIMVEHINFSYYFESEAIIASKQISVISPTEMKPLFDVYLILLQKHNLQIKLIPTLNGSERLKYYTCRLAVHDVLTTERLWKCSFEDWEEFKWKDVNVKLSHFNESREGNRVIEFKNRSLHLELEFTFSTGEDLTINEHTVSRRS
ncbi:speckle-type POZ protein B [Nephila pilipes]|uniref:Speckle-type POZ protein B n=1 Tax=Nephila pilipes TaxID=299642 RepID=A0A8X6NMJ5_NEPPI|nr:speckle-type POZ protein B [Nephila pilipes]